MSNYYPFKCKKGRETEWLVVLPAQIYYTMLHLSHMQTRFENSNNCFYNKVIFERKFIFCHSWIKQTFCKVLQMHTIIILCKILPYLLFSYVSQVFTAKMSWVRHLILKGGGANNFCQKRQSCKSNNRATRLTSVDKKPSWLRSCTFYRNLSNAASHW